MTGTAHATAPRCPAEPLGAFARAVSVVRRIIGAPDYAAYLAHVTERHPWQEPLSEQAFLAERLEEKYSRPGQRCC